MALLFADNILNYARNYRVCYIGGRYGGGKTALAFRLAYELCLRFEFRYILSNVSSIWCTPPDRVVLRDGFVDAVIVLDEGGMFLDDAASARQWLAFLRKINVVLLVPSVLPPSLVMRRLSVQRLANFDAFGVPLWYYGVRLDAGIIKVRDAFFWLFPSEIYGIYDTRGMPTDANELLGYIRLWTRQVSSSPSLPAPAPVPSPALVAPPDRETEALVGELLLQMAERELRGSR